MSRPPIQSERLTPTLSISEFHKDAEHPQGWWVYDHKLSWSIGCAQPTRELALVEAVETYQKFYEELKERYTKLKKKVDLFVDQINEDEE